VGRGRGDAKRKTNRKRKRPKNQKERKREKTKSTIPRSPAIDSESRPSEDSSIRPEVAFSERTALVFPCDGSLECCQCLSDSARVRDGTRVVRDRSRGLSSVPRDGSGGGRDRSAVVEARVGAREVGGGGVGRVGSMVEELSLVGDEGGGRVVLEFSGEGEGKVVLALGTSSLVDFWGDGGWSELVEVGRRGGGEGGRVGVERDVMFETLSSRRVDVLVVVWEGSED